MSIENIVNRILAEAREQGDEILKAADIKSRDIAENAKKQALEIQRDFHERAAADSDLLKSRSASVAELEARKMKLSAKQVMISRCFDLALDRLADLEEQAYLDLLASAIFTIGVNEGEILLNERDRETIGKKLIERVNGSAEGPGSLVLSENTIDAKGGFVLRKGSMEINSTLESMVGGIREAATPDVVNILFGS